MPGGVWLIIWEEGQQVATDVVTTRRSIIGQSNQRLVSIGPSRHRLAMTGQSTERVIIAGTEETRRAMTGQSAERIQLIGNEG